MGVKTPQYARRPTIPGASHASFLLQRATRASDRGRRYPFICAYLISGVQDYLRVSLPTRHPLFLLLGKGNGAKAMYGGFRHLSPARMADPKCHSRRCGLYPKKKKSYFVTRICWSTGRPSTKLICMFDDELLCNFMFTSALESPNPTKGFSRPCDLKRKALCQLACFISHAGQYWCSNTAQQCSAS
ncbi:hypothetical protein M011DRAFT_85052 [Sporormia fimetaria CBS 119925]|uniref:Uncharacterized protein n=1 Tax=Sporormia fimetaria CBS 119925 TaxID=1340428 RepID=A0A6A6V7K6_9PLEO|nr:hypothetical protein M011DRAFT_85052 [Sporormia fimetaria CBS 119925]